MSNKNIIYNYMSISIVKTKLKTYDKIRYEIYDDGYFGFESTDKNVIMKGSIDQRNKKIKLDFFHRVGGVKGFARLKFCKLLLYLLKKKHILDDFNIILYADASFGNISGASQSKLEKMYESMSFTKFGEFAYGNQPMKTSVKKFIEWCKEHLKKQK